MSQTHSPRKFQINPEGGPVSLILLASQGDNPQQADFLRPTLSHVSNTGNHIIKPVEKSQSMRRWEIPAKFDEPVTTEADHQITLRKLPPPPPTVKFSLAVYVLSRTGAASVIYADLFVRQGDILVPVLDGTKNPERFGGGLKPRIEYAANLELFLAHPPQE